MQPSKTDCERAMGNILAVAAGCDTADICVTTTVGDRPPDHPWPKDVWIRHEFFYVTEGGVLKKCYREKCARWTGSNWEPFDPMQELLQDARK